ncbi:SipW-dependent-type signal peptide-containing protein [Ruania suaedae]|uniref:SipW-dependent-type signal peptide-containing protein n=1 Tax=Ruania suaedae TaxID=2897774 RepID=UPI001E293174|nr:SipW-dependent-type signal peptide-containing protein [Ruania suaedae]UFU03019.1 SipW-dependent-type signal peptide-containing protein [Ruania suaedae]
MRGSGPRRTRLLRLRALLAGGLVLGLGSAVTLAAWNDSEYATTTVTASTFGVVGSVNGGAFSEHPTSGSAATLAFSPAVPAFSPGTAGYTSFGVRTTASSTVGGSVTMQTPTIAGPAALQNAMRYAVRLIPSGSSCNAALFTNTSAPVIVPNETALATAVLPNARPLTAAAGSTVSFCVRMSMIAGASTDAQGQTLIATWQFLATSE